MKLRYFIPLLILLNGCVETFEFEVRNTEKVLVVDASLTNERKAHQVKLAMTHPLDDDEEDLLSGAKVWVEDNEGQITDFQENENGIYETLPDFQGVVGNTYELHILTDEGEFVSTKERLPEASPIDSIYGVYVERASTETAEIEKGVQFFLATHDDTESSSFYRYEFQQDYEIWTQYSSAWRWNPEKEIIEPYEADLDKTLCYKHNNSTEMIIETTSGQMENRLSEQPITFIRETDEQLRHRYSLSVQQYKISPQAYQFYKKLKENNENGGSFFDKQKGIIVGNIQKKNDVSSSVYGYFEVAGVSKKSRYYYTHYFANQGFVANKVYASFCEETEGALIIGESRWASNIRTFNMKYYDVLKYEPPSNNVLMVHKECSDCRVHGGNLTKPDFWD